MRGSTTSRKAAKRAEAVEGGAAGAGETGDGKAAEALKGKERRPVLDQQFSGAIGNDRGLAFYAHAAGADDAEQQRTPASCQSPEVIEAKALHNHLQTSNG